MKNFSINDLERFSEIKAPTFRMWEKRYPLSKTGRTASNRREYSLTELKELLNVALLTRFGCKISKVAAMTSAEIEEKVRNIEDPAGRQQAVVNDLVVQMYAMDACAFEDVIDSAIAQWGYSVAVKDIIYPFLVKTQIIWRGRQLNEEHFVVTTIRRKVTVAIDSLPKPSGSGPAVLLYLTDQSQLDLALLYAHFVLKQAGRKVVYLGNDISKENLKAYMLSEKPEYLFTYMHYKNKFDFDGVSSCMEVLLPQSKLVISTYPEKSVTKHYENIFVTQFEHALTVLSRIKEQVMLEAFSGRLATSTN